MNGGTAHESPWAGDYHAGHTDSVMMIMAMTTSEACGQHLDLP